MSLKKKERQAVLLTDKITAKAARTSNLLLVMTLFLQLILPVAVYANASPSGNDTVDPETEETQSDDNIESLMTFMQTDGNDTEGSDTEETAPETPEVPVEAEEEAPPADDGVADPVEEPEPEANSPPPAPVETPEAPEPAPEAKEPVVEEKVTEEKENSDELKQNVQTSRNMVLQSTVEVQNYFVATGTSTNDHYTVKGVYIATNGDVHLILDNDKNTANQTRFHSPMLNGQNAYNYSSNFNTYNQYWEEIGTSITLNRTLGSITVTGVRMFDFNLGPMIDLLQETNTLQMLNQADGFSIRGMTFTLDLNYRITKDVVELVNGEAVVVNNPLATIGDEVIYKITTENNGDFSLTNVNVYDYSPPGVTILQVSEDNGQTWTDLTTTEATESGTTYNRATLAEGITLNQLGGKREFLVKAYINSDATDGQILTNKARIGGSVAPKEDTATVTVKATDVVITKEITGDGANPEEMFTFTYSISRPGTNHHYSTVNGTFTLGHNGTHSFTNLPTDATLILSEDHGDYEVTVTSGSGNEEKTPVNGEYIFSLMDLASLNIKFTNNKTLPRQDLVAKKIWNGGPEANKQPVMLTLWRSIGSDAPIEVDDVNYSVNPTVGPSNEFTYTWTGLPTEAADGTPYTYYFTEEIVSGYTREYSNLVEFGEDKFGGFNLPNETPAHVTNTFEIQSESKEAVKKWVGGENVRPPLWFQLWRTGPAGNEPVPNVEPKLLDVPADSYEAEVSVTFLDIDLTDFQGNVYGFYVVEGTYDEATDTFTPGAPENFVQSGEGLHLINTYSIPTDGTASATKNWQGATSSDFFAVPLTLWRSIDGSVFEEVEVDPTINPTEDGETSYVYAWAGLEETDAQGNAYTFYFSEDIVPDGYERTYQGTTITGTNKETEETITVVESGGSVTNSELFIDFTFEKVNEVGLPIEGAVFELHRHGEGDTRELVARLGENPVTSTFTFEDLTKGTYTLTEVSAPDEYILPENNTWTFEVKWDDELERLVIEFVDDISFDEESGYEIANYPKGRLPETGGPGNGQTMMISLLAFTLLVTLGMWRMKRDEVNQND